MVSGLSSLKKIQGDKIGLQNKISDNKKTHSKLSGKNCYEKEKVSSISQ
tara:strand:- start:135330 stop:135476 length:147 start_codon:yes stop_codon:yes gene_type:complete